jgi:hypothetical protein
MPKPSAYEPPPAAPTGAAGEGQADAYDDERSMSNDTSDRSGTVLPVGQRPGPWSVPKGADQERLKGAEQERQYRVVNNPAHRVGTAPRATPSRLFYPTPNPQSRRGAIVVVLAWSYRCTPPPGKTHREDQRQLIPPCTALGRTRNIRRGSLEWF